MIRFTLFPVLIASLFLTACETVDQWLDKTPSEPPPQTTSLSEQYLGMISHLATSEPALQQKLFEGQRDNWLAEPSPATQMAYALALATPGHANSDAQAAQTMFSQLLANPDGLANEEMEIIRVFMSYAEQWKLLANERDNLAKELAELQEHSQLARDTQLKELRGQLNTLRQQLKDAESKLDAIANIEREMERLEPQRN